MQWLPPCHLARYQSSGLHTGNRTTHLALRLSVRRSAGWRVAGCGAHGASWFTHSSKDMWSAAWASLLDHVCSAKFEGVVGDDLMQEVRKWSVEYVSRLGVKPPLDLTPPPPPPRSPTTDASATEDGHRGMQPA